MYYVTYLSTYLLYFFVCFLATYVLLITKKGNLNQKVFLILRLGFDEKTVSLFKITKIIVI